MIATQLSLFDTPSREPRCRDCGALLLSYPRVESRLCNDCLERCPKRANKDGTTSYLTVRLPPSNWRELYPYCDDFRIVNGVRVRSAGPLFYQDEAGVVWKLKDGLEWEYERWSK